MTHDRVFRGKCTGLSPVHHDAKKQDDARKEVVARNKEERERHAARRQRTISFAGRMRPYYSAAGCLFIPS